MKIFRTDINKNVAKVQRKTDQHAKNEGILVSVGYSQYTTII